MPLKHVWIFPVLTFVIFVTTFLICYAIALKNGHILALFPFISDTGTLPPESCIFGQMINIGALFMGICIYLRHRQIVEYYGHHVRHPGKIWRYASFTSMWIGFISAFGGSMVANFQSHNLFIVHVIGAFLGFVLGIVYGWTQTIISYAMNPPMSRRILSHVRLLISVLGTGFFIAMEVSGTGFKDTCHGSVNETSVLDHCLPSSPKYTNFLVTTFSEWLLAVCALAYIMSFAVELRHAVLHPPKLVLKTHKFPTNTLYIGQQGLELSNKSDWLRKY